MAERRALVQGVKSPPSVDPDKEAAFVFGGKSDVEAKQAVSSIPAARVTTPVPPRVPLSTRIRTDLVSALKRASLERQLSAVQPNTMIDILEEAIEPWLRQHGYLS